MIRPICVVVSALLLATACVPPAAVPEQRVFRAPPPALPRAPPQAGFRGYRLSSSFVDKGPFRDGAPLRRGAIVNGLRVRTDASGLCLAESVTVPPLQGGVPLPDSLGGGLLFWNDSALYTADTFLSTLKPLLDIGFRPVRVSFGPSFALLRGDDGQRLALDLRARQRVPITPPLLVDIASTPGGRALALLEGGVCQISDGAAKGFRPLALPAGSQAVAVREVAEQLVVSLSTGAQIRLDREGKPQLEAVPRSVAPRPTSDALWPLSESPLERALAFGVPIGQEFAAVAVAGSVATVNLRTGELLQMTRALVPSDLSCRALDSEGGLLLACSSREHGSILISDAFGERPVTQAKFPPGVALAFAEGVLVAAARCDGQVRPGAACVRSADGHFHDFDVSPQLATLEKAAPQPKPGGKPVLKAPAISRWLPKLGGGAVAVMSGSMPGLLDAQSGSFVPFAVEVPRAVFEAKPSPDAWLGLDWVALKDGSVRGWLSNAGVTITADGRVEPSVYEFSALASAGARALAFDRGRHVFQTADWGRSWVETLAPPGSASGGKPTPSPHCSLVGCVLGPWLRVGWEPEVPAAFSRPQVTASPPGVIREPLPFLVCRQLGAPVVSQQAPRAIEVSRAAHSAGSGLGANTAGAAPGAEYENTFSWAIIHPINGIGPPLGLRASLSARVPTPPPDEDPPAKSWPGYALTKRFSFVPAFEPRAPMQSASITWRALFDAAAASGAPLPSLEPESGEALPVLGPAAGEAEGLLLDDDPLVWLHGAGAAEAISIGAQQSEAKVIGAVARGPHLIDLLNVGADGSLEVLEVQAGKAHRLFQMPGLDASLYPTNPDALALGVYGALAVLRTPSGNEPATSADPALLFHQDGTVSPLAPWSRLFLADAPECRPAPNDFRTVLQTSRAWLHLVDAGLPVTTEVLDAGMFAVLRVNSERLCLEAVELGAAPAERQDSAKETRLAARFVGSHRGAARLAFAAGFELRQPLSCSLSTTP